MKRYRDLDLKAIREEVGLDFAHYTYKSGQCSCCYGPKDMASIHWKDRVIPEGDDYTYLLFKNASNGSGVVSKDDWIESNTCIEYYMSVEQRGAVCRLLQEQLGEGYEVINPGMETRCIEIMVSEDAK